MRVTTPSQTQRYEEPHRSTQAPLLSETSVPQIMPPVFRTGDLVALFLLNVFWVTNITPIAAGGPAGFLYWMLCGGAFFIPCSLVMAQLAKMFPHEGSILSWTAHALGARWSFFVGICAWLPGMLSIVNAAAACISWVQALNSQWLTQPWQQGIAILVILVFTGLLACQRTRVVQYVLNMAASAMGLSTVLIVWAVSFFFPFLDVCVSYFNDRALFQEARILPLPLLFPVLAVCCVAGIGLCLLTIGFTLSNSFIPTLIPNSTWWYIIGGSAPGGLIIFAAFSLLTNSEASWEEMRRSV